MTDTSGPTKEAMKVADRVLESLTQMVEVDEDEGAVTWDGQAERELALAIDAHTQALRAENALLRDRLRLAVEAMKEVSDRAGHGIAGCSIYTALAVDAALCSVRAVLEHLRAAGVEV